MPLNIALRPHQERAIDLLRQSMRTGHRRPILQAPCGFGKTLVAAFVVDSMRSRGMTVAFGCPGIGLIDQTVERFAQYGIPMDDMGVIQANHPLTRGYAPIQICTAQTLARRTLPLVDALIVDEAHIRHQAYEDWLDLPEIDRRPKWVIGLSATPWAKGLGLVYDDLLKPTSTAELIEQGYLSPFKVYAPSIPDLSGVKTLAGDYNEGQLGKVMSGPKLVADVIDTWLRMGRSIGKTLCFAVNREHAKLLHDRFEDVGVRTAYVDAFTPREERDEIGRRLGAGEIEVVCNIGCLTTGIDWDVRCLILARPTKSEILFVQIIGRALRTADGKDHALILDHTGTHHQLGMVTDIDHDELDMGRKETRAERELKDETPKPRECHACGCLVPPLSNECPACGTARKPISPIEEVEGELVELGNGKRAKVGKVIDVLRAMPRQEIYSGLIWIAHLKGRSEKWAAHGYREIYGTWPNRQLPESREPDPLLRSWVKSRDIAYAKAKRREQELSGGI